MNNEFDWWLLIVGLVGGAGLAWLMLTTGRDSAQPDADARQAEAEWIADRLAGSETPIDGTAAARVLALHHDWETGGDEIDWDWDWNSPDEASAQAEPEEAETTDLSAAADLEVSPGESPDRDGYAVDSAGRDGHPGAGAAPNVAANVPQPWERSDRAS